MSLVSEDLFGLRFPAADESLKKLCRIAAVRDSSFRVDMLAGQLSEDRGFLVDNISPDENITAYFREYHPDVLLMNVDQLGVEYVSRLSASMKIQLSQMPLLVSVGYRYPQVVGELSMLFRDTISVGDLSTDPFGKARQVRSWLIAKVAGREMLYNKLLECARLFIKKLGSREDRPGSEFMAHAVVYIMLHPYTYFASLKELCTVLEEDCGADSARLVTEIRSEYRQMVRSISDDVKRVYFGADTENGGQKLREMELIYRSADVLSQPCSTIIGVLRSGFADR